MLGAVVSEPESAPSFAPRHARVSLRRTWAPWLAVGLVVTSQAATWVQIQTGIHLMTDAVFAVQLLGLAAAAVGMLRPRRIAGQVAVDTEGISVDGVTVIPRSRIKQASRFQGGGGTVVRIQRKRALHADLELDSDADADELLRVLAQDTGHATASFVGMVGGMGLQMKVVVGTMLCLLPAALISVLAFHALVPTIGALLLIVVTMIGFVLLTLSRLVVGADGILVRRIGRAPLFFGYDQLLDVSVDGNDVVLTPASGAPLRLAIGGDGQDGASQRLACMTRIAETQARFAAGAAPTDLATVLRRGERDASTWLRSLEALLGDPTTYRAAPVLPEQLWRIVEDPTQPEAARAGAAIALRRRLDDDGRARLRVASATSASGTLRTAFEAAETDDEEAARDALEPMDAEPRRLRAEQRPRRVTRG